MAKEKSNFQNWARLVGAGLAVALAGCATPPKQALDQAAARKIQKVAVVEAREPTKYVALNFGHPGMIFGAIGGAIAGASMEENGTKLTEAWRGKGFGMAKRLSDKTAEALEKTGYVVVRVPDVREIKENKLVLDYRNVQTDADVILNVTPTIVGYISTSGFADYIPAVGVIVELVRKNKDQVDRLYQDRFMFGWAPKAGEWVLLDAPAQYRYASFDTLLTRQNEAAEGILAGAELIAARLATDIRRKPQ